MARYLAYGLKTVQWKEAQVTAHSRYFVNLHECNYIFIVFFYTSRLFTCFLGGPIFGSHMIANIYWFQQIATCYCWWGKKRHLWTTIALSCMICLVQPNSHLTDYTIGFESTVGYHISGQHTFYCSTERSVIAHLRWMHLNVLLNR